MVYYETNGLLTWVPVEEEDLELVEKGMARAVLCLVGCLAEDDLAAFARHDIK